MKKYGWSLLVVGLFAITATVQAAELKKYDVKSGIITLNSITQMGTMEMKSTIKVYFDDFGMKECKETYEDGQLSESLFSDGKTLYSVSHKRKRASKNGVASRGTEVRIAFEEMGTKKDRDSGKVKKIAPMTIAGKSCETFEMNPGTGTITRFAGWKGVMVYMQSAAKAMTTTITAEKIEENIAVPQDKFKVPAGYKLQ